MPERLAPDRDAIAALPAFDTLPDAAMTVVATADDARAAAPALLGAGVLGFDTESRPTFVRGADAGGPHVAQFATADHAWVLQLHDPACRTLAAALLESTAVRKVGFGLDGDLRQLRVQFATEPQAVLDLDTLFRQHGFRRQVGVKAAVAIVFGRRFAKSKKTSTTNWAQPRLTPAQVRYAAHDAWAARRVWDALQAGALPAAPPGPPRPPRGERRAKPSPG